MTDREKKRLEKIIFYILGRRPDEFGLLPDGEGFVSIKDLYKALVEEKAIKNLNIKRLIDFFLVFQSNKFEYCEEDRLIRVKPNLISPEVLKKEIAKEVPPRLFVPVRPRAWIKVIEQGLKGDPLILTPDKELAEKLARRKGALIIEVDTRKAQGKGTLFERYLQKLYITSWISADALRGPKVDEKFKKHYKSRPKEREEIKVSIVASSVPFYKITRGQKRKHPWKGKRRQRKN